MTGTGTENDPYICTKLSEIISVQGDTTVYIELPPNSLIDANDEYPEGFTSAIYLNCHLDGKGSKIRNISAENAQYGRAFVNRYADFKNINLLNVRGAEKLFERASESSTLILYKCKFSGRMESLTNLIYVYNGSISRCSFNFECLGAHSSCDFSSWDNYDGFNINYNRIELNCAHFSANQKLYIGAVSNCYITGNHPGAIDVKGNTNVVDFTTPTMTSDSRAQNILVNSDKCTTISSESGIYPVTTAQMKDAAYLASLGFPIQT